MKKPFRLTPPDPKEDQFQQSVVHLLDAILRPEEAIYTHIPVGGYELSPAARARLYRLGLHRGWPDLLIAYGAGQTLWLELKAYKGVLSIDQKKRHAELVALGHTVVVCRRIEDVLDALELHKVPFRKARLAEAYHGATVNLGNAEGSAP